MGNKNIVWVVSSDSVVGIELSSFDGLVEGEWPLASNECVLT